MKLCMFIQMNIASPYSRPRTFPLNVTKLFTLHFIIAGLFIYLFIYLQVSFLIFPLLLSPVGVHCSLIFNPFCSLVIISPDVKMNNFTFLRPINIVVNVLFPKSHPSS
jgi:hypothetical protein